MIPLTAAVLSMLTVGPSLVAQGETPPPLIGATRCLALKQFLPRSTAKALRFGFFLDANSYPQGEVIYVVNYSKGRSAGHVYTVFLDGTNTFNIQNNARFVQPKSRGISFLDPPLGGIWTQEHLTAAIKKVGSAPLYKISTEQLNRKEPQMGCNAYTDH